MGGRLLLPISSRLVLTAGLLGIFVPALAILSALTQRTSHDGQWVEALGSAAFNILFFGLLLSLAVSLPSRCARVSALALVYVLTASFVFVYLYHLLLYRQPLGDPSVAAILDTNPGELTEFLRWALNLNYLAIAATAASSVLLALLIAYPLRLARHRQGTPVLGVFAVLALMSAIGIYERTLARNNQLFFFPRTVSHTLWNKRAVAEAQKLIEKNEVGAIEAVSGDATHVLIIGEASTRRHMSLYGYGRPTSPRLEAIRSELHVAQNACSSRGATAPALQEMLTFATRTSSEALYTSPTLLQIMKAAGYKIFWLSNQQMYGKFDNWSTILSAPAEVRVLVNRVGWSEGASFDGQLLEPFEAALADPAPKKLIIVHLLGAHADYKLRYPPEFEHFPELSPAPGPVRPLPRDLLSKYNAYDNAMLYDDHVVAELIARVMPLDRGSVTFLSDHGEALGETSDFIGHIDGPTPKQVYEIPLLFWLSKTVRERFGEQLSNFQSNLTQPFQSDALIHNLLDLYGVRHPLFRGERSLFSPAYQPVPRYCDTLAHGPWTSP